MSEFGRVGKPTRLSSQATEPVPVSALTGFDPSRDVEAVVADLATHFGPGYSNGVVAILVHRALPEHFGRANWDDWCFRPAEAAFDWAHNRGLISPWKLSGKWTFTPLGLAVSSHFQKSDSDGSGEAGETEGLDPKGESAGPKDIAKPAAQS